MPTVWNEHTPNLDAHEYEIYSKRSSSVTMSSFHVHDFYEIRFILKGIILHNSEVSSSQLFSGTVTVIPPGMFHRINQASDSGIYERILLYVSRSLMDSIPGASETLNLFGSCACPHISLSPYDIDLAAGVLSGIIKEAGDGAASARQYARFAISAIISRILMLIPDSSPAPSESKHVPVIPRVISYINQNLRADLSLDALSESFFISKYHLSRVFREYTSISLHRYIQMRRILCSKKLLTAGYDPGEVAQMCGYSDYSTFYKAFVRDTGLSPSEFAENAPNKGTK